MSLSALFFAGMNLIVKELSGDYGSFQLVFFRAVGSWLLCMGYLLAKKIPVLGSQRRWLVFR
ncbi:MAG: EamA/RhaT family transporter, partial [Bacteroidota bacterium]